MKWAVIFHPEFDVEFTALTTAVQDELLASLRALQKRGPVEGRPLVDTLKGSRHANMKELRFRADDGVWRAAFAFDPMQRGIILVAGDKNGGAEARFYRSLITVADRRYDAHLKDIKPRS